MEEIILVKPSLALQSKALEYRKEHFDFGEKVINGSELFDKTEDYPTWLERVILNSNEATVAADWVLTDTFFALRKSDLRIIGMIDLRYCLNDFLKDFGNCGYSVRPTERNKGYATQMLAQVCAIAKKKGLKELQLSVERDNLPSVKTILKNGGVYQRSFAEGDKAADVYIVYLEGV